LPAYAAAIAAGADFVECDVHLTADLQPICRHDADLSATTDAAERFPSRERTREVDGLNVTGVFACDLTLDEVRTLRARQRWPEDRGTAHDGAYGVATLDELMVLVDGSSSAASTSPPSVGRVVGLYPETKHAAWHDAIFAERWRRRDPRLMAGLRALLGSKEEDRTNGRRLLERAVVARLAKGGYLNGAASSDAWRARPAYVQSFEIESLRAVEALAQRGGMRTAGARLPAVLPRANKGGNAVPLVLLLGGWPGWRTADTGETLERQLSRLETTWAREVDGVGPWKESLFAIGGREQAAEGGASAAVAAAHGGDVAAAEAEAAAGLDTESATPPEPSGLLPRLKAAGLVVHAYSVRPEQRFVLPGFGGRSEREMAALFFGGGGADGTGVDGAFADHPAAMVRFLVAQGLRSEA
jgi:glycerophosphoryl diester phosphodiesterase